MLLEANGTADAGGVLWLCILDFCGNTLRGLTFEDTLGLLHSLPITSADLYDSDEYPVRLLGEDPDLLDTLLSNGSEFDGEDFLLETGLGFFSWVITELLLVDFSIVSFPFEVLEEDLGTLGLFMLPLLAKTLPAFWLYLILP